MTPAQFRKIALSFSGVVESEHQGHPDFRIAGKVFATLGYPDANWSMVKLTPEQQLSFVEANPEVFRPSRGAWGQSGTTIIRLATAKTLDVRSAQTIALENITANLPGHKTLNEPAKLKRLPKNSKTSRKSSSLSRRAVED